MGEKKKSCQPPIFCCSWVLRRSLTSQVISVVFYIEREKSDKFCSEALISAWGFFYVPWIYDAGPTQRLYSPFEGSRTQDFYALKNPSTSDPVSGMITTGPPGSSPLSHSRRWLQRYVKITCGPSYGVTIIITCYCHAAIVIFCCKFNAIGCWDHHYARGVTPLPLT